VTHFHCLRRECRADHYSVEGAGSGGQKGGGGWQGKQFFKDHKWEAIGTAIAAGGLAFAYQQFEQARLANEEARLKALKETKEYHLNVAVNGFDQWKLPEDFPKKQYPRAGVDDRIRSYLEGFNVRGQTQSYLCVVAPKGVGKSTLLEFYFRKWCC
jgi:hypothetical protein